MRQNHRGCHFATIHVPIAVDSQLFQFFNLRMHILSGYKKAINSIHNRFWSDLPLVLRTEALSNTFSGSGGPRGCTKFERVPHFPKVPNVKAFCTAPQNVL